MRRAGGILKRILLWSLCLAIACGCQLDTRQLDTRQGAPRDFAVSLIPVGSSVLVYGQTVGFRIATTRGGFAHLYSIDPVGQVRVWAENMPVSSDAAVFYPRPADNLTIRAGPPAGEERVILMVTEHVIAGFAGRKNQATTVPAVLPYDAARFRRELDAVLAAPANGVAAKAEIVMRIVEAPPAG
jgi:hypothetical protein